MNLYKFHKNPEELKGHDERHDLVLDLIWKQVKKNGIATPKQEDTISRNAEYSYRYAKEILKGPFPKGEDVISRNAEYSYRYAFYVLHTNRFLKGEKTISKNPSYAYVYARFIVKGRWPEGEDAIAKDLNIKRQYEHEFKVQFNKD